MLNNIFTFLFTCILIIKQFHSLPSIYIICSHPILYESLRLNMSNNKSSFTPMFRCIFTLMLTFKFKCMWWVYFPQLRPVRPRPHLQSSTFSYQVSSFKLHLINCGNNFECLDMVLHVFSNFQPWSLFLPESADL